MTSRVKVGSVINLGSAVERYQDSNVNAVEVDQILIVEGHNPRGHVTGTQAFEGPEFDALKASIASLGDVFQPVLLRPKANSNMYELVAGERRLRAARALGLHKISAVVRKLSDDEMYRLAREENLLRSEVSRLDLIFSGLDQLARRLSVPLSGIRSVLIRARDAGALGKTLLPDSTEALALEYIERLQLPAVSTLVRLARMLELTPDERQAIRNGLAEGAALALLDLGDHPQRPALLQRAISEGWSAARAKAEVKALIRTVPAPGIAEVLAQTRALCAASRVRRLSDAQQAEVTQILTQAMNQIRAIEERSDN
ncbi:ParB/RepB/Spo0J family partition protein [Deinococcus sonorensis]|uniref:ParB/RepB/Spo0J family partition protein n=1 Tax=Deinococcus sonorensis TaxID=309891 RepID=A0ABV8Y8D7_9DEIO